MMEVKSDYPYLADAAKKYIRFDVEILDCYVTSFTPHNLFEFDD